MVKTFLAAGIVILSIFFAAPAFAAAPQLQVKLPLHWLTVASTQNRDEAIGIASFYASTSAKVVSSKSGWFAVILGPYAGPTVAAVLRKQPEIGEVPKDALFSNGENYVEIVWENSVSKAVALKEYSVDQPLDFKNAKGLSFKISMAGDEDNPMPSVVSIEENSLRVFDFATSDEYSISGANAGILRLDPNTDTEQFVFTRFSGGAHCCTHTWIATKPHKAPQWTVVDAGMLDSEGFRYEDLDADGGLELLSVDNRFLYTFDSYAGSFAPLRIEQLRGDKLIDVSSALAFQPALRQDLGAIEFAAKLDPSLWRGNGFLAGWIASKIRLGQGDEAWATIEKNIDQNSDFGPQRCRMAIALQDCPAEDLIKIPVKEALATFLSELDYGPLPEAARAYLP